MWTLNIEDWTLKTVERAMIFEFSEITKGEYHLFFKTISDIYLGFRVD